MPVDPRPEVPPAFLTEFRAGYGAIAGRPNVGKSTLLNAWVGEHLSIVSPTPQTTRERVLGICTRQSAQVVLADLPGLLEPKHSLHRSMLLEVQEGLRQADLVLLVCDASDPESYPDAELIQRVFPGGMPLLIAVNKTDLVSDAACENLAARFASLGEVWLVSIACRVEEFREDQTPMYIRATVFVERASQKGIVVGSGGEAIRRVAMLARRKIEALVPRPVYLDLWVQVLPGWRRHPHRLRYLGYRLPRRRG